MNQNCLSWCYKRVLLYTVHVEERREKKRQIACDVIEKSIYTCILMAIITTTCSKVSIPVTSSIVMHEVH